MLRHFCLKRHLRFYPPPRKVDFSGERGEVGFLRFFHEFLKSRNIKYFGKNLGQAGTFVVLIGRFPAISGHKSNFEISKIRDFGYFQAFLGKFFTFFFKMRFSSKIVLKTLKIVLGGASLAPEDDFYLFFDDF